MKSIKIRMRSGWGWLLLGAVVALGAAACGEKGQASEAGAGRPGGGEGRVTSVYVAPVEIGTIARRVTVSGVVEPIRTIGINSQLSGALVSVDAEEGVVVREGAVLARLDDRELRAQLASAEAALEVAESTYRRAERLRERSVITEAEFERDRAAYVAAQAQRDQIRTRIEYATIRAPGAGIVTQKNVEAGDIVAPQTRLFTLADVSTMVVRVQVSELDVVELSPGDAASVILDAYPGQIMEGRIRRVFPSADPTTRLVPVEVALQGEGATRARPGFLARVTLALGTREGVPMVPASAIVGDGGANSVFIVRDGIALRRGVVTGMTSEGRVEIVSGIEPGELVVTAGNTMLRDGAAVRIIQRGAAAQGELSASLTATGGDR